MAMVGEDRNFEKDLRLIEFRKERSENLSLEVRGGREKQRWSEERAVPEGLILIRLHR